jgi:hypothetical protein
MEGGESPVTPLYAPIFSIPVMYRSLLAMKTESLPFNLILILNIWTSFYSGLPRSASEAPHDLIRRFAGCKG